MTFGGVEVVFCSNRQFILVNPGNTQEGIKNMKELIYGRNRYLTKQPYGSLKYLKFHLPSFAFFNIDKQQQVEEEYMYWCEQIGQEALPPGGRAEMVFG